MLTLVSLSVEATKRWGRMAEGDEPKRGECSKRITSSFTCAPQGATRIDSIYVFGLDRAWGLAEAWGLPTHLGKRGLAVPSGGMRRQALQALARQARQRRQQRGRRCVHCHQHVGAIGDVIRLQLRQSGDCLCLKPSLSRP